MFISKSRKMWNSLEKRSRWSTFWKRWSTSRTYRSTKNRNNTFYLL